MRINSKAGVQFAALDDADSGEGLAIFLSQGGDSVCRYRFLIKARIGDGTYDVGEFYSSPPLATTVPGRPSRMIAGAICPGAEAWSIEVSAVGDEDDEIVAETANVVLSSSRCCANPGVNRVGERYQYATGTGASSNFLVLAGMKVTGISAFGLTGGGLVIIGSGDTIIVPEGVGANLAPQASISPNTSIDFTDVDWIVEYLESA